MNVKSGNRIGIFLLLIDQDGCRHAIRLNSIVSFHDQDPCADTTVLALSGGRNIIVPASFDEVAYWISST